MRVGSGRTVATIGVVLSACVLGNTASAARPCRIIEDPAFDTTHSAVRGHPGRLDIVSADVATTRDRIIAVVRLRGWTAQPAAAERLHLRVVLGFFGNGNRYTLQMESRPDRVEYSAFAMRRTDGPGEVQKGIPVSGSIDEDLAIVRIEAPRSLLFDPTRRQQITGIGAGTRAPSDVDSPADLATARRDYVDMSPTCVT